MKPRPTNKQIAEAIARELFEDCYGNPVNRLTRVSTTGEERGGWHRSAVVKLALKILEAAEGR